MLTLSKLDAGYGASRVLHGMSLQVKSGQAVSLLGRNGMGKTTTVKTIMGLLTPTAGHIEFEQTNITNQSSYKIAQAGIGLVPEGRQIFPNLNVRENLLATAANRSDKTNPWGLDAVYKLFPVLNERQTSMGNRLSGGEQQMLSIARALMTNPKLLILDEATEGLAPLIRQQIWNVLGKLKQTGISIFIIDKNIHALTRLADQHYIIEKGKVVWAGNSSQLSTNPQITEHYLGV